MGWKQDVVVQGGNSNVCNYFAPSFSPRVVGLICDLTRAEVPLEVLHLPDEHPAHRQARVVLRRPQDRLEELPRHLGRHRRAALPVAVSAR